MDIQVTDVAWFKRIFLKYLKRAKLASQSVNSFLDSIFRVRQRTITTYKCIKDIELRGAVWVDSVPIDGYINRRVLQMRAGQPAWIREDDGESFITLENSRGVVNIEKSDWYKKFKQHFDSVGH